MTVSVREIKFSLLTLFIVSFLLCIFIQTITSADVDKETINIDQIDETNQTIDVEETKVPTIDDVLSDSIPIEVSPIIEVQVTTTDDKSNASLELSPPVSVDNETVSSTSAAQEKNLSSIHSFEEWKQQQLQADLSRRKSTLTDGNEGLPLDITSSNGKKGLPSSANSASAAPTIATNSGKKGKLRKNFASASCGAKLLAHNAEAQNTGSILSSSPDEYMLNPCNVKIWFVIELCESIRILNIEIANFELFSSVPKTFRVSASDRYPTKEWHRHQLGTFNASFNRTIQSFQTIESSTYLKYVKFELLDFHGHEHYCPLSVVRVHGSNVEDEIMTMEDITNANDLTLSSSQNVDENEEDENSNLANDQQVGGIIGSAILDLAKRVFRRQTIRGTPSTTTMPTPETIVLKPNCVQSVLQVSLNNSTLKSWRQSEAFKQCLAKFLHGLWTKIDTCIGYLSQICFQTTYCCQCPVKFQSIRRKLTINFYQHPCGYYHLLTNQFICNKEKQTRSNVSSTQRINQINGDVLAETVDKNRTIHEENVNLSNDSLHSILPNETQPPSEESRSNESLLSNNTNNDVESLVNLNLTNQSSSHLSAPESIKPIDSNLTDPFINTTNEILTTTMSPTSSSTALPQQETFPPIISSPWLKGMLVNTKSLPELFKIIEKLNFNLTLSNRYLQELSQHYVKKLDETQQTTDLLLKASKAADLKFKQYEEYLLKLQDHVNELSYRLMKLEAWIPLIICILFFLFIWCVWSTCVLLQLRRSLRVLHQTSSKKKPSSDEDEEEEDEDDEEEEYQPPKLVNGIKKRKSSTDSNDSNLSRSQRVPDSSLAKIKENGHHSHTNKQRTSPKTKAFTTLSTVQA